MRQSTWVSFSRWALFTTALLRGLADSWMQLSCRHTIDFLEEEIGRQARPRPWTQGWRQSYRQVFQPDEMSICSREEWPQDAKPSSLMKIGCVSDTPEWNGLLRRWIYRQRRTCFSPMYPTTIRLDSPCHVPDYNLKRSLRGAILLFIIYLNY